MYFIHTLRITMFHFLLTCVNMSDESKIFKVIHRFWSSSGPNHCLCFSFIMETETDFVFVSLD